MLVTLKGVPQEVSGVHVQDTLETSLFAPHLFPTDDGPAHRYPIPLGCECLIREQGSLLQFPGDDVAHPAGVGIPDFGWLINPIAFTGLLIGSFPVHRHFAETGLQQ